MQLISDSSTACEQNELEETGDEMYRFAADLYPICRSITGDGLRETLKRIQKLIPIQMYEVESGTQVFDWTIPKEWNIREAYIKGPDGKQIVNQKNCNLHVLNYSIPIHAKMPLSSLKEHIFTSPEHPAWIPYRTSYYMPAWGFCIAHDQMLTLGEGEYEVFIDTSLEDGSMTYGEYYLEGSSSEEVLISAHVCHPSLANDNLSGITVAAFLARLLDNHKHRYSYRFVFVPGTIGTVAWLARNKEATCNIRHGLVLTCLGDKGGFHYKKSRRGDAEIDRITAHVLQYCGESSEVLEYSPYGYDERQYNSPGFNLPVGCLMRSVGGSFPEYHTSADNLTFIHPAQLARSMYLCTAICSILENNKYYLNQYPFCEPQLGKRNLVRGTGGESLDSDVQACLWVLNLSDGKHSLLDIAERSGLSFSLIHCAAKQLIKNELLADDVFTSSVI